MKTDFEIVGYHVDYYIRKKYQGSVLLSAPDRDVFGYDGRRIQVLTEEITTSKNTIKIGTEVTSECIPLCGKLKNSFKEKIQIFENSRVVYNY